MDKDTQYILSQCAVSTKIVAKTFFPERFFLPFAEEVHGKIFDLIDGPANKVAIAAPRGWGKTSIVALSLISRWILFHHTAFIVYINKSETAAIMQTENLRRELVSNKNIKHFFGNAKTKGADGMDEQFSKKSWVAYNTFVLPRGAGQQVRGVLFKNDRPGLIVIDDLEDPEKITNDDIRSSWKQWLYADVIKSVPQVGPAAGNYKIVYIDTLKHEDSVLQMLLDSSEWESVRLEACDDDFNPTAPQFKSKAQIDKDWQDHVDAGQTDVFFREFRNLPISTKDSSFQQDHFKYYNVPAEKSFKEGRDLRLTDAEVQLNKHIETVIIMDPAKTVKIHSAETAIEAWGIDLNSAKLYLRDAVSEKLYPDEIYDVLFQMGISNGATVMGIEDTSLNEFIRQPIKNEMFKRGKFFELVWLKTRGGMKKELRVKALVPYYRQGYIYHNASCTTVRKYESQLLMFPRSKLWDLMDCAAYIIEMLELGERYFSPPEDKGDIEAEYRELEYDNPMQDWRQV